jgi:hypothetical protein
MTDEREPNGYELQRSITELRKTVGDGLTEIKVSLAGLVSRDLFEVELRRQQDKFDAIQKQIDEINDVEQQRAARFRWLVASVSIPLITCLIGISSLYLR